MNRILGLIVPALALAFFSLQSPEAQAAPMSVAVHVNAPDVHRIWIPGRLTIIDGRVIWVAGHYEVRAPRTSWVPGHYVVQRGHKVYVPGHWR